LSLYPSNNPTNIYIYGVYSNNTSKNERFGALHIGNLDTVRFGENVTHQDSQDILDFVRNKIKELCPDNKYKDWLTRINHPGIESLIHNYPDKKHTIIVSFENHIVKEIEQIITPKLHSIGEAESDVIKNQRLIRAAYNFSKDTDG